MSTNWPSSRIATRRSWEAAEITNSFDMKTPYAGTRPCRSSPQDASPRASARRRSGKTRRPDRAGDTWATPVVGWLGVRSQREESSSVYRGWSVAGYLPGERRTMLSSLKILLTGDPGLAGINNSNFFSGAFRRSRNFTRHWRLGQLTKRRSRTFITRPIARKTNNVAEPP